MRSDKKDIPGSEPAFVRGRPGAGRQRDIKFELPPFFKGSRGPAAGRRVVAFIKIWAELSAAPPEDGGGGE